MSPPPASPPSASSVRGGSVRHLPSELPLYLLSGGRGCPGDGALTACVLGWDRLPRDANRVRGGPTKPQSPDSERGEAAGTRVALLCLHPHVTARGVEHRRSRRCLYGECHWPRWAWVTPVGPEYHLRVWVMRSRRSIGHRAKQCASMRQNILNLKGRSLC